MNNNIKEIINNYYYFNLKINLQILNIFTNEEQNYILKYIFNQIENKEFEFYNKSIKKLIEKSIYTIQRCLIIEKINLILNNIIFIDIDKKNYISPAEIIKPNKIPKSVLQKFLKTIVHDCIIQTYINNIKYTNAFNIYSKININTICEYKDIYNISENLRNDIKKYYFDIYIPFYTQIINKHDNEADYIFPIILDNNLLLSRVLYDNSCTGGDNSADVLKLQLSEMSKEPYIKNLYTKSDISMLENILKNNKLNGLIKQKKIHLSKNFQNILSEIGNTDKNINLKDYINKVFIVNENDENINSETIADIITSSPDQHKFLEYFIDKIIYYQHLNNNTNNSFKEIISVLDNVFEKILDHNYDHNSLNLENDDIKFILMLETLETLKNTSTPVPYTKSKPESNITLNVYKDINKAKINGQEIKLDY